MKYFAPDYYSRFSCIKGDCRHSCCIGWEIDIDADTLEMYRNIPGEIGHSLSENIVSDGENAHFRLRGNERCPFLNSDDLCDLILELGEDSLCQICADHPRFRNFYSDREEIGLGMCCEAAAALILGQTKPVKLVLLEDDGEDEGLFEDEADILELRDDIITILQDRTVPIESRIARMLEYSQIEMASPDPLHWKQFLLTLERLDDGWAEMLEKLCISETPPTQSEETEIALEQLMVYLVYRHLNVECEDLTGRIAFCALIWQLLRIMLGDGGIAELCEIARLYSSEIEYSDENISAIIPELRRLNPGI